MRNSIGHWAALVIGMMLVLSGRPSRAQFFQDLFQEWRDEIRLQRDESRLQYDISTGNMARAYNDLNRIGWDQQNLAVDRQNLRNDLFLPFGYGPPMVPPGLQPQPIAPAGTLIPHPQYPGYGYNPANPNLLYPITAARQGAPPNVGPGTVAPRTPATLGTISVVILNGEENGVTVNYVVDGLAYSTASGAVQRLDVGPKSTIVYDRGGALGEARYSLSAGAYEFRFTPQGWAFYKSRPSDPAPTTGTPANRVPNNIAPPSTSTPPPDPTSGGPFRRY